MYFEDGKYSYIGLVNSEDAEGREVWAGCNSAGFAIMNSASYNLKVNDTTSLKDQEGVVMKKALQSCATLNDFEKLLQDWEKPIGVEANFGVIDAEGGAAYYETTNFEFRKIDVNDPKIAPHGYVIRTNYSFTGEADQGYGYIRYLNAENLFYQAAATNQLDYRFIIQNAGRSLKHSLTGDDLALTARDVSADEDYFVFFEDFIPRNSSCATVVVQGVKEGESADFTTMWTVPGFQLCTVTLPLWVAGGADLPEVVSPTEDGNAPLCDMGLQLKAECFPIERGSGKRYMNLPALLNSDGSGILQKIIPVEDEILTVSEEKLAAWREGDISQSEIRDFYRWLDRYIKSNYHSLFGLPVK